MVDYKKKYLKYKKKYLKYKKIFHNGGVGAAFDPSNCLSPLTVASATAPELARVLLDEVDVQVNVRPPGVIPVVLTLRAILETPGIFDTYIIERAQIDTLKDSIAVTMTNFPLRGLANDWLVQHGVTASVAWAADAFLQHGNRGQSPNLTERIRRWFDQDLEYNAYSDIIRCILGREIPLSKTIRHILESKVTPQLQCTRILGPYDPLVHPECYLCGIPIDTLHAGTAHCEHLLPVGQALAIYWLAKANPLTIDQVAFLQHEYRWSCSCCNKLKSNRLFITPPDLATGRPFSIDNVAIGEFVVRLCERIDPGTQFAAWAGPYLPNELPNGDPGGELAGTETLEILCQRKKFQFPGPLLCSPAWMAERVDGIMTTFERVCNIINYNFLKRGRVEMMTRTMGISGVGLAFAERPYSFVELAKIEMKVKIILALGDKGLVELFCRTNVARRSFWLGYAVPPGAAAAPFVFRPGVNPGRRGRRKKRVGRAERGLVQERERKRESDAAQNRAATAEKQKEERGKRLLSRRKEGGELIHKLLFSHLQNFEKGELKKKEYIVDKKYSELEEVKSKEEECDEEEEEEYGEEEEEELDEESAEVKPEWELSYEDREVISKEIISPRGFTKYLLFEIFEEMIEYLPENNIFILFVITLLIDDDMNTSFYEKYYKEQNTLFERLINELTEIIDNFELPPKKAEI